MKIDLTNCKTPEDIERALKPLGDAMKAMRSAFAKTFGDVHVEASDVKVEIGKATIVLDGKPSKERSR